MNKFLLLSIFKFTTFAFFVYGHEQDCGAFDSIQMAINSETTRISEISFSNYVEIAEAHITRGESYLICEEYENALQDFLTGLDAINYRNVGEKKELYIRTLFGLFIAYGNLNLFDQFYVTMEALRNILDSCKCENCHQINISSNNNCSKYLRNDFSSSLVKNQNSGCKAEEPSIAGPDVISVQDCIERVDGTEFAIKALFSRARSEIRFLAFEFIHALTVQARDCCYSGGLWKGCLRPIINKWQQWKICGIPADPAWD